MYHGPTPPSSTYEHYSPKAEGTSPHVGIRFQRRPPSARASPNALYQQDGGDFTPDADFCNMRALTVTLPGH